MIPMTRRLVLPLLLLAAASLSAQLPNPLGLPDPLGLSKPKRSAPAPRVKGKAPRRFAEPRREGGRPEGDRGHHGRGKAKGRRKH